MRLALERTFCSFRKEGWRFIVLDDVLTEPDGSYIGEFVEEQLAFLRTELLTGFSNSDGDLWSHSVGIGFTQFRPLWPNDDHRYEYRNSRLSDSAQRLRFAPGAGSETKANVRLVLAGHLHHLEQIQIDNVSYINGGAICGNWWKGPQKGCPEGFTVLDLSDDGHVRAEYRASGWKAAV